MNRPVLLKRSLLSTLCLTSLILAGAGCKSSKTQEEPGLLGEREVVPAPAVPAAPTVAEPATLPEDTAARDKEKELVRQSQPKAKPVTGKALSYTVQKGDSLSRIAALYGVSVEELAAHNHLKIKDVLHVGKKLEIPPGGKYNASAAAKKAQPKAAAKPESAKDAKKPVAAKAGHGVAAPAAAAKGNGKAAAPVTAGGTYTVQTGDNLWIVAKKHNVRSADIRALNNLKSDSLQVGQKLTIPAGGSTPAASAPATATPAVDQATPAPAIPAATTPADLAAPAAPATSAPVTPAATPAGAPAAPAAGAAAPAAGTMTITALAGDTLAGISQMYLTTPDALKKLNPGINSDADLKPGVTQLKVPMGPQ